MINLPSIVIANSTAVIMLAIVILSRQRTIRYGLFDEKLYSIMAWLNIMLCISETLSFIIDGTNPHIFRIPALLLNSAVYSMNIILTLVWTLYVDFKLFEDPHRTRKFFPIFAAPALIIILCNTANIITPIFFRISKDNVYSRTSIQFIPCATAYMYLLYGSAMVYRNRVKAKRYLFLPIIIFLAPVVLASIFQYFFYGISLLWLGTAIGLVSLYINVQNQASYIDSLSGVFNRHYLGHYLAAWAEGTKSDSVLVGFMLDIDEFKQINDHYGHLAGDQVIASVGKILRIVTGGNGFAARYGGDEFVIIQRFKPNDNFSENAKLIVEKLTVLAKAATGPWDIRFSVGFSVFDDKDTVDTFISRIDSKMYEEKSKKCKCRTIPDRNSAIANN